MSDRLRGRERKGGRGVSILKEKKIAVHHDYIAIGGLYFKVRFLQALTILLAVTICLSYLLIKQILFTSSPVHFQLSDGDLRSIAELPPWLTEINSKSALLASLNLDNDKLNNVSEGTIYNVSKDLSWRRPFALVDIAMAPPSPQSQSKEDSTKNTNLASSLKSSFLSLLSSFASSSSSSVNLPGVPEPNERDNVYTYFDTALNSKDGPILEVWKKSMWAAGFDPVVLTENDSKKHPKYKVFVEQITKDNTEYRNRNLRWLAWASKGGGIFMDYRLIPVHRPAVTAEAGMLSRIKFYSHEYIQRYDPWGLSLVTGGQSSERIVRAILEGEKNDQIKELFDRYYDDEEKDTFALYTDENVKRMAADQKTFSPLEIAQLMNTHLHHAFLKQFKDSGIAIIDPLHDDAHALTIPSQVIAHRIAKCPANDQFYNICPPTPRLCREADIFVIKKVPFLENSAGLCNNPCASNDSSILAIPVENLAYLPEISTSRQFSIIGVPHPLTVLSVIEKNISASVVNSRARLQRNTYLRQLTSEYIPGNTAGTVHRLLLAKDAIYQVPSASSSIWFNWEDLAHPSTSSASSTFSDTINKFVELVEWEFGFSFDRAILSNELISGVSMINTASIEDIDKTSGNQPQNSLPMILEMAQKRVLGKDTDDKSAIEAWNLADTEIWKFLAAWTQVRFKTVEIKKNERY